MECAYTDISTRCSTKLGGRAPFPRPNKFAPQRISQDLQNAAMRFIVPLQVAIYSTSLEHIRAVAASRTHLKLLLD